MTVQQLKDALSSLPENKEVLIYISDTEEYGHCSSIHLTEPDNFPYSKCDVPERKESVVIISGFPA